MGYKNGTSENFNYVGLETFMQILRDELSNTNVSVDDLVKKHNLDKDLLEKIIAANKEDAETNLSTTDKKLSDIIAKNKAASDKALKEEHDDMLTRVSRVRMDLVYIDDTTKREVENKLKNTANNLDLKIDQTKNELTNQAETDRRSFATKLTNASKKAEAETAKAKAELAKSIQDLNDTLTTKIDTDFSEKLTSKIAKAGGFATLNQDGLIPSIQLPSFVDDVVEGFSREENGVRVFYKVDVSMLTEEDERNISEEDKFEEQNKIEGEKSKIYVDLDTSKSYRWSGSTFVEVSSTDVVEISEAEVKQIWAEVWGETVIEEVDPDADAPEVELSHEEKEEENKDIIIDEQTGITDPTPEPVEPSESENKEPEITIDKTEEVEDPSQKKEESEGQDVTVDVSGSGELNYDPRTQKPDGTPLDGAEEKKEEVDQGTTEEVDSGSETETDGSSDNQDVAIETVDPDESEHETEVESKDGGDEDVVIVEPEEETDDTDKGSSEDGDSKVNPTEPEVEVVETEEVPDPSLAEAGAEAANNTATSVNSEAQHSDAE